MAEKRYISTEYLGECETCRHCVGGIKCNTYCDHGEEYSPNLAKIPTADVVEVVRCKDCMHCFSYDVPNGRKYFCRKFFPFEETTEVDFCRYGKRGE